MGFLDKVKETANKVGEAAQQGVKVGQEKLEDAKLKKRVGDLEEELGAIVYAQRAGSPPADAEAQITRIVDEIRETKSQLATLEAQAGAQGPDAGAQGTEPTPGDDSGTGGAPTT